MAYCTSDDVRTIISSSLEDNEITALIVLADQEITDRKLTARGSVKRISMYLTAEMIALKEPSSMAAGGISTSTPLDAKGWRDMAESLIKRAGEPPIVVANDPLPNE
jgi:hypothetical protein